MQSLSWEPVKDLIDRGKADLKTDPIPTKFVLHIKMTQVTIRKR